ncbi:MAG: DUF2842 domain-containing protein [Sphingobium sp.]|nr:DUF2842 domain-containing protein [Sphingobium sp.]
MDYKPTWRKPTGMLLILAVIAVWAFIVASFSQTIGRWPGIVQLIVYVAAGIVWIFPMRPVLIWMETGRWR